eukprot:scaffold115198_cov32-Attheya_sp.AAC.1
MQSTRTAPAWISLFGLPPEAQPQTDEDGSAMILRVDRAAPVGLTPKKKKARFLSEEPDRDNDEFILMDLPEVGGLDPQEMVARIGASWPVMQEKQPEADRFHYRFGSEESKSAGYRSGPGHGFHRCSIRQGK